MIAAGDDVNNSTLLKIYDTISIVYTPAPQTVQVVFQWFGFAYTLKWIPFYILDDRVNSFQSFSVLRLPIQVVVPGSVFP